MIYGLDRASYNQGRNAQFDFSVLEEQISTFTAKGPGALCHGLQRYSQPKHRTSNGIQGGGQNSMSKYIVRRLTPRECERLQGYPDDYTLIGEVDENGNRFYIDSNGKKRKVSDSVRYKALGNSIGLPAWKYILKGISETLAQDGHTPTMASLFDGLGGFSLIWESINGKGTCLWASEIEEFPIAVTKERMGE